MEKIVIVGASSGIGADLARILAKEGHKVAALARRFDRLEELRSEYPNNIFIYEHDVLQPETVPDLLLQIGKDLGGIDTLVYSSGVMPDVSKDPYAFANDKAMVDVNITGAIAWINEAAKRFEAAGRGTIVGIGSVAGVRGRGAQPVYNASKGFLHIYLESLRNRIAKKGVKVTTVKPGPVDTEMTKGLNMPMMMPSRTAAEIIAKNRHCGNEIYLSFKLKVIFFILRNIPSFLFRRLKI